MCHSVSLLILAAGLGSRFGGDKQIFSLSSLSLPMLAFSLQDAVKNGIVHVVIVTRFELAHFFEKYIFLRFPSIRFDLIFQDQSLPLLPFGRMKPWGTGHAILCAKSFLCHRFIVINADDFYGFHAIAAAVHFLANSNENQFCCVGYPLVHTLSPNGPVSRGIVQVDAENFVVSITEISQIQRRPDGSIVSCGEEKNFDNVPFCILEPQQPVSLNLFGLHTSIFPVFERAFQTFLRSSKNDMAAEFGLPNTLTMLHVLGGSMTMKMVPTEDHWLGITYREDIPFVESQLDQLIQKGLYS